MHRAAVGETVTVPIVARLGTGGKWHEVVATHGSVSSAGVVAFARCGVHLAPVVARGKTYAAVEVVDSGAPDCKNCLRKRT